jgi:hypothetical protein
MIALAACNGAADGKARVKRKSRVDRGSRLIQCTEQAQGSTERKMAESKISVRLNASP